MQPHGRAISDNWKNRRSDLSSLAGKTIYAVKLFLNMKGYVISSTGQMQFGYPQSTTAPTGLSVVRAISDTLEAEAQWSRLQVTKIPNFEVYEKDGDQLAFVDRVSSASAIYLPRSWPFLLMRLVGLRN